MSDARILHLWLAPPCHVIIEPLDHRVKVSTPACRHLVSKPRVESVDTRVVAITGWCHCPCLQTCWMYEGVLQ